MGILRLHIALDGMAPEVTRVVLTPEDLRLDRLHQVLQAAFGWEDRHLWEFSVNDARWGLPDLEYDSGTQPAQRATVSDLLTAGQGAAWYTYDFGDHWRHRIQLEAQESAEEGRLYPRLEDVTGRCPPEDVGGTPGYEDFLEAMVDPQHPEHADMLRWYGSPFDPLVADQDELRFEVLKLARKWRPKKKRTG